MVGFREQVNSGLKTVAEPINRTLLYKNSDKAATSQSNRFAIYERSQRTVTSPLLNGVRTAYVLNKGIVVTPKLLMIYESNNFC